MDKEKNKKVVVKREMRTDSENEPTRVYRPRTLKARPVGSSDEEIDSERSTEKRETTTNDSAPSKETISEDKPIRKKKENSNESYEPKKILKRRDESSAEGKSTYKPRTLKKAIESDEQIPTGIEQEAEKPSIKERTETSEERPSSYKRSEDRPVRRNDDRPDFKRRRNEDGTSRNTEGKSTGYRSTRENKSRGDRDEKFGDSRKPYANRTDDKPRFGDKSRESRKPYGSKTDSDKKPHLRLVLPQTGERKFIDKPIPKPKREYDDKPFLDVDKDGLIRLNKYIANTGLCSRREADEFIENGMITINGEIIKQLGTKVDPTAEICFKGKKLETEHKVYILLNKPKDYITTVEDPNAKRTVMELIEGACTERVYPVGRLDRNSTGLLLLTNDGEMTKRLTHPSFMKKKIYHVGLDKVLAREDMEKILAGVEIEGEVVKADAIEYTEESDGSEVGIEIHTGQNRVVRNMFDILGYKVSRLDRVYFAGLTKKNLPRGKWRFLSQKEINMLKMNRFE
ncbi:MAG: pseudouridine synthase [Tenuifilaceae bacterium]